MKLFSGILTLFFFPAIFLLGSPCKVSRGSDPVQITGHILAMDNGGFAVVVRLEIESGYYVYASAPKGMPYSLAQVKVKLPKGIRPKGRMSMPGPESDPEDPRIGIFKDEVEFIQLISDSTEDRIICMVSYQYCNKTGCSLPITKTITINKEPVNPFDLTVIFKQPVTDTMRFRYRDIDGQEKSVKFLVNNGFGVYRGETCQPFWNWYGATKYKNNGGFLMGPAKMTLFLDTANYGSKVEGSPWHNEYTKEYRPFGLEEEKTSRKFINDYVTMRERVGSNPGGHQEDSLNYLYQQYEYYKRLKDKNYIKSKPDSDVSLALARNMFRSGVSFEEINEVYNLLSIRQKESIIGQELYRKVIAAKATGVGSVAPDFFLQDSSGKAHSLASFRGKYVLVDFWKYGCIPCIEQFPKLRELYAVYQPKGFEILGVFHCVFEGDKKNYREWMSIVQKERPTWTGLIDYEDAVCQAYGVEAFPSNFLLGPDGKVITYNIEPHQLSIWLRNTFGEPIK